MADDTPDAPAEEAAPKPRRRNTRTTAAKTETAAKPVRKPRATKSTIQKAEEAVVDAASKPAAVVASAARKPAAAVADAAKSAAKAVKPRAAKRTTPRTASRKKAEEKKTGWGKTAIAGGLAVAGAAATAAVLALRGSTPKPKAEPKSDAPKSDAPKSDAPKPGTPKSDAAAAKAHQPDGADSSKSFAAGIADEGTIPETTPGDA